MMPIRGAILPALLVALVLTGISCSPRSPPPSSTPETSASRSPIVRFPSGRGLDVELAIDDEERSTGLMFRESVPENRGMLFVFSEPMEHPFWMKNCHVPLDILWIDEKLTLVSASYETPPCRADPCPSYPPAGPALFVLETAGGAAKREGLVPGERFVFENLPLERLPEAARRAIAAAGK